jgi:pyruvate formate lyase activating enzyme
MQIAGIQKLTLVDFPGRVAATVFTRGCSFRCGFCHNPELVIPEEFNPIIDEKILFEFLKTRYGKLTGICITGGEPCLQPDIAEFITHMKALGFEVKLDTNGSFPASLEQIIKDGDVDYIAMDVKAPLSKYESVASSRKSKVESQKSDTKTTKQTNNLESKIQKSIELIMNSGVDYEFRTTVCHPLHAVSDFEDIGVMIKGAPKYFIQNFVHSKSIDESTDFKPFTDEELAAAKEIMERYVDKVGVR